MHVYMYVHVYMCVSVSPMPRIEDRVEMFQKWVDAPISAFFPRCTALRLSSRILHTKFMSYVCVHVAGVSHGKAHVYSRPESKV